MRVIIIGGGVIGVLSAYYLAKAGYQVHVFERNEDVGTEATNANGAQLSYTYVSPLASPQIWSLIPKVISGKDDAVKIKDAKDIRLWQWFIQLLMNAPASIHNRNQNELLSLGLKSRFFMEKFLEEVPLSFDYQPTGKMQIFDTESSYEKMKVLAAKLEAHDIHQKILSPEACIFMEPSLKDRKGSFVGGIYSPIDATGDAYKFTLGLRDYLEKTYGVIFHMGQKIERLIHKGKRVVSVLTSEQRYDADIFVLASGAGANGLLKTIGSHMPIYPVKGYSLTVPREEAGIDLKYSLTDHQHRIVFAPLGDQIKIAGFMHFEKLDKSLHSRELEQLKEAATAVFPKIKLDSAKYYAGFRPYTPNSTPIVKRHKFQNFYVNLGHGMLGWTLSQATCQDLSRQIIDDHEARIRKII